MRCVESTDDGPLRGLENRGDLALRLERDEPLSRHSSLRIGGPAEVWAEVGSERALREVVEVARRQARPLHVVGLGSNVLFPDDGLSGIVVRLTGALADWEVAESSDDAALVRVGGGTVNAHLVRGLLDDGWIDAEFLRLIPGTFGGAVAMNAGTKEAELSSILQSARVLRADGDVEIREHRADELQLGYRDSSIDTGDVVVDGTIRVRRGDVEVARREMERDRERRDETQPYKLASAGSTFANPDGDYAGRLIDDVGLKGVSVGDARISETHANFFINDDEATAADFLELMAVARLEVRRRHGVELRPEVEFVGFDGMELLREFEQQIDDEGD